MVERGQTAISGEDERVLVSELAELALADAAPEELALFPETADDYFRDPDAALHPRGREEAVGFGLEIAMVAPYILAIAQSVVRFLASAVEEGVQEEVKTSVAERLRGLLRRGKGSSGEGGMPPLTLEQRQQVRASAYERARQLGLDDGRAAVLADSVVGGLVLE